MSRIQSILEKAERDGSVRHLVSTEPAGVRGYDEMATVFTAPPPAVEPVGQAPLDSEILESAATAVPARIVTNARLDRHLLSAVNSESETAEQYRALRTRVLQADNGSTMNVILVTSPGRGEGKTLTAANLALTMAQEYQRRICLVDADMRHPQLHRLFGLPDGPGLSDVLTGRVPLEDALITLDEQQITILPSGRGHGRPAELLGTSAMRRLLETLRSQFDRVVVDSPATAPLADVGILTPLVDSVLLVVRAGVTVKPAIHDAVSSIDASKLLGVVLNEAA
jgi:capsular exopolysaccharide synthesis family protein